MSSVDHPAQGGNRRHFLQWTGAAVLSSAATSLPAVAAAAKDASPDRSVAGKSFKLGIASYTFRKFDLDKTIALTRRAGLNYLCLKSMHLPLESSPDQIAAAVKKVADAGLTLYGGGVINMQKEVETTKAFDYAKATGMKVIVAAPTIEMLPLIDKKIQEYGIAVAIHNHGPTDKHFPTPESAYEKIKSFDPRFGLCIDIGHTVRVGANLVESVEKCADRLLDFHIKDVTAATAKGKCIQMGRGVIDLPAFFRALAKLKYNGVLSYEYEIDENDPLPGLCECVGYTHGALAAL